MVNRMLQSLRNRIALWIAPSLGDELRALRSGNSKVVRASDRLVDGYHRVREILSGLDAPNAKGELDEAIRRIVGGNSIVDEMIGPRDLDGDWSGRVSMAGITDYVPGDTPAKLDIGVVEIRVGDHQALDAGLPFARDGRWRKFSNAEAVPEGTKPAPLDMRSTREIIRERLDRVPMFHRFASDEGSGP